MNIGILTYFNLCNFGANLQALSTFSYFKNKGHNPIMINWMPEILEKAYIKKIKKEQYESHTKFCERYFNMTEICRTSEDVANVIRNNNIEAVIVGSDAVAQHHTFISRIVFPTERILSIIPKYEDTTCPNPFWGTFNDFLKKPIPIAMMSVSNQNSNFRIMKKTEKQTMKKYASLMKYISTRDKRTSKMFSFVSNGIINPPITPDPVFAFNFNVKNQPSEDEIRKRFNIKGKYILVCLQNPKNITKEWLIKFEEICILKGYQPVAFPLPEGIRFSHPFKKEINIPLDPMDWYCLIKYSNGYIGCNMHPIVVSLHNAIPCLSFDNYGVAHFRAFIENKTSKIYHIMNEFGVLSNRIRARGINQKKISPEEILNKLESFDREKINKISNDYIQRYQKMMSDIEHSLGL